MFRFNSKKTAELNWKILNVQKYTKQKFLLGKNAGRPFGGRHGMVFGHVQPVVVASTSIGNNLVPGRHQNETKFKIKISSNFFVHFFFSLNFQWILSFLIDFSFFQF